jgi:transposase
MSRRRYDRAFKVSAVELLEKSDRPLVQIARELGIHDSMLRRWRNQVRSRGSKAFDEAGRAERSEVVRLRRENRRLKRELEMVKKTLVTLERLDS